MKINSIMYYNANMSLKYSEKYAKELLNLFFKNLVSELSTSQVRLRVL